MAVTYQDGVYTGTADITDQWNQALAEYEARARNPRFIPGAANPTPDTTEQLRRELLGPLELQAGAITGHYPPPSGELSGGMENQWSNPIHLPGGEVMQVNRITGQPRVNRPANAAAETGRMSEFEKIKYENLLRQRTALAGKQFQTDKDLQAMSDLDKQIAQLENAQNQAVAAPVEEPTPLQPDPFAFIGSKDQYGNPLGQNRIPVNTAPDYSSFMGKEGVDKYTFDRSVQNPPTSQAGYFASEADARAAGYKANDVVYLKGIGKVKLK